MYKVKCRAPRRRCDSHTINNETLEKLRSNINIDHCKTTQYDRHTETQQTHPLQAAEAVCGTRTYVAHTGYAYKNIHTFLPCLPFPSCFRRPWFPYDRCAPPAHIPLHAIHILVAGVWRLLLNSVIIFIPNTSNTKDQTTSQIKAY